MNEEFQVHMLNEEGKRKARLIAEAFDQLLTTLTLAEGAVDSFSLCPAGREMSIVRTKLEEASFFAKKAMANEPSNCVKE